MSGDVIVTWGWSSMCPVLLTAAFPGLPGEPSAPGVWQGARAPERNADFGWRKVGWLALFRRLARHHRPPAASPRLAWRGEVASGWSRRRGVLAQHRADQHRCRLFCSTAGG